MRKSNLSKRMAEFMDNLYEAEFGYKPNGSEPLYPEPNPKQMVRLLKRALSWKTHKNLIAVAEYCIGDYDERTETVNGCKEIIREDLEYWNGRC